MMNGKRQWRERIRAERDALTDEARAAHSRAACLTVVSSLLAPLGETLGRPLTVCAYGAFRSETDPSELMNWCLARGHRTVAPRMAVGENEGLELRAIRSASDWTNGRWGVPEPDPQTCELIGQDEPVDVVIVPGLAFDRSGGRLGYGGGYYDRLYEWMLRAGKSSAWIGFAYDLQLVTGMLPREPHDLKLDGLATESEWIRF
ncbi:5-formyltetrahydrofolate cyclo-ligase [Cohnella fermenti]|uniref:5-formyltetrahydrofolate cyclo-ligase n=1 Tax=Cohnella fermenti TaxID=2565925 RepID=A0A4S4BJB5_9BACL|nr:5-formyltetrahydrofolate cyclo-ligase [Cohnella fermenti]THF74737.1 5-formyltetrahydrofolate cyclo-ligase [Cohnella fermenti]